MSAERAAALERLKTFAGVLKHGEGPSHAADIALVLELLRDSRKDAMAAVCWRCRAGELAFQLVHVPVAPFFVHAPSEAVAYTMEPDGSRWCMASGIRALPGA